MPGQPVPEWLTRPTRSTSSRRKLGVDARGARADGRRASTASPSKGVDPDFRRGESLYDHFYGDPDHTPNPNLGTIEKGPFYALQVHPGAIGTKGGARVNVDAQVLRVDGEPIPGLYAAGNVMAGVTGAGYPGAGATIAAAMTFGYIAGRHAARRAD